MLFVMTNQTQFRFSDIPVVVTFAEYFRLRDRFVTIENRHYLPQGNQLKPVQIAWQSY